MVLTKEELMNKIKERIGDDKSDETIKFLEDITDTYDDLNKKIEPNKKTDEEWKAELEAKDKEWRDKYTARFFDSPAGDDTKGGDSFTKPTPKEKSPEETITVNDLFTEKGEK